MNFVFFQETGFNIVLGLCTFEIHSRQNHHSQFFLHGSVLKTELVSAKFEKVLTLFYSQYNKPLCKI